jgi:hypothetical protein
MGGNREWAAIGVSSKPLQVCGGSPVCSPSGRFEEF